MIFMGGWGMGMEVDRKVVVGIGSVPPVSACLLFWLGPQIWGFFLGDRFASPCYVAAPATACEQRRRPNHNERDILIMAASKRTPKRHGESSGARRGETVEYRCWRGLRQRCCNPKTRAFKRYGGRGIIVCERWLHSYENFLADMGRKPTPAHSIDRINGDGNYEPGNCRWATQSEQMRNVRRPLP